MTEHLELRNVIGMAGDAPNMLLWHPNGKQIIHALGSVVVLRDLTEASKQSFLRGHDGPISTLALSSSGRCESDRRKTTEMDSAVLPVTNGN